MARKRVSEIPDKYKRKARSLKASYGRYGILDSPSTAAIESVLRAGVGCPYCKTKLTPRFVSIDHIIPRSRGGSDTRDNTCYCCLACNLAKGALTGDEYMMLLHFLNTLLPIAKTNILARLKAGGAAMHGWKGSGGLVQ